MPEEPAGNRGFSLLELIAALAVLAIAGYIGVALYTSGSGFARTARERDLARTIAREALAEVRRDPGAFDWPETSPDEARHLTRGDARLQPAAAPSALPALERAGRREQNLHAQFQWRVAVREVEDVAGVLEATAVVEWNAAGRPQSLTLTSWLQTPRVVAEGAAS